MNYPEIQLMDSRAIIKLNSIFPKYLQARDIRIGEADNFILIGKHSGKWNIYRRLNQDLSETERSALVDFALKNGISTFVLHEKTMSVSLPAELSVFLDNINSISGCRVSPVSLQSNGDIYLCIEFEMSQSSSVSKVIMDYLRSKQGSDVNLIYYGRYAGKVPYIFNIYQKLGNSLENLTIVETRWEFNDIRMDSENEGLFLNHGILIPKQFSDSKTEGIIMKLESPGIKGSFDAISIPGKSSLVETQLKSSFFNDFFLNVILEYSGPISFAAKCDATGLTNCYIVETDARDSFLKGLFKHWSLGGRHEHVNFLLQVRNLGSIDFNDHASEDVQS
ncbi:MAG: hypothetical protein ACP5OC_09055 [Thermoplasmata archaeon]